MPLTVLKPTITAGQSLSSSVNLVDGLAEFIVIPANWTMANISWQFSADGTVWGDVCTVSGMELLTPADPGCSILFPSDMQLSKNTYMKIRSGSKNHPVPQQSDVELQIAVST